MTTRVPPYRIVRNKTTGQVTGVTPETKLGEGAEIVFEHNGGPGYGESLAGVGMIALASSMFRAGAKWARANPDKQIAE